MLKTIPPFVRQLSCWLAGMRTSVNFRDSRGLVTLVFALLVSSFLVVPVGATAVDPPSEESTKTSSATAESGPIFSCPANSLAQVELDASGSYTLTLLDLDPTYTGTGTINRVQAPQRGTNSPTFTCAEAGNSYQATVRYNEGNGNMTCALTIEVVDNISPVFASCVPNENISADANCEALLPDYTGAGYSASDNCSFTVTQSPAAGTSLTLLNGVTTVTLTATDPSGNAGTCTFDVTLVDDTPPTVTCPGATTLQTGAGSTDCEVLLPDYTGAAVTDNCSTGLAVTQSPAAGTPVIVGDPAITVTLSAVDGSGNTGSCTFAVDAVDDTPPVANCIGGPLTVSLDVNGDGSLTTAMVDNGSTDNCAIVSSTLSQSTFTCADIALSPITVTLTVTDAAGLTDACDVIVNVEDDIDPTAACQNVVLQLDASGNATLTPAQVENGSSDNCGLDPAGYSLSQTAFDCSHVGVTTTVTYTVTDLSGNTGTCTADITVEDNVAPDAQCQNLTLQLDANGEASIGFSGGTTTLPGPVNVMGELTSSDPQFARPAAIGSSCSPTSPADHYYDAYPFTISAAGTYTFDMVVNGGGCFTLDSYMLIYDGAFNPASACTNLIAGDDDGGSGCNSQITITLTMVPGTYTLVASSWGGNDVFTYNLSSTGVGVGLMIPDTDNGSTDACGIASYSLSQTDFTCSDIGTVPVTMTVTDVNGNSSTCISNVTIEDNIDPVANCVAPLSVDLDANGSYTLTAAEVDNTSTDNCGPPTLSISPTNLTCSDVGTPVTVTLTATDATGNSNTCTTTVTVNDITPPTVVCVPYTVTLDASGNGTLVATDIDGGSSDACGIATYTASQTAFDCSHLGTINVDLTVTDNNGNSATCTAMVTVVDVTPPVVAGCPAPTGGQTHAFELVTNPAECLFDLQYTPPTAMDACSGPIPPIVGSLVSIDAVDQFGNTIAVTQNFDGSGINTSDRAEFPLGVSTVTYTFSDASGNESTCVFNVFVEDLVPPSFVQVNNPVVNNDPGECGAVVTFQEPVAIDNCPGVIQSQTDNTGLTTGDFFPVGTTTLEYTATDAAGLMFVQTITVTVNDAEAPVISSQATINQNTDLNLCSAVVNFPMPTATDNCPGVVVTQTDATGLSSGSAFPVGTTTLEFTATDAAGLTDVLTFDVVVTDAQAPEAICDAFTVQLDANGDGSITAADIDNGSNDACGIASLSVNPSTFTCANVGPNTVTLTVTDNNGNVSTCTATVTVVDNVLPTASCQPYTVQLDASGNASITAANVDNGSNDACGIASLSVSPNTFTCTNIGANAVTLTVTDNNGNVSTCTTTVTVEDNEMPSAVCKPNVTVQLDANGAANITAADIDGGSMDACGIASLAIDVSSFDCSNVGPNTVTLTVTDNNGNVSTCTSVVTVEDNVAPEALCQNITLELDANGQVIMPGAQATTSTVSGTWTASDPQVRRPVVPAQCVQQNRDRYYHSYQVNMPVAGPINMQLTAPAGANLIFYIGASSSQSSQADICNPSQAVFPPSSISLAYQFPAGLSTIDVISPVNMTGSYTLNLSAPAILANTGVTVPIVDAGSTDNCGIVMTDVSQSTFDCTNLGQNTVTFTVTDAAGNAASCTSVVTVVDNIAPVAECKNITVQLDPSGSASITGMDIDDGSSDNCSISSLTAMPNTFDCSKIGANTVTLTVTDGAGNTATCTAIVTVIDNIPPTFTTCSGGETVDADASCGGVLPDYTTMTSVVDTDDNCAVTLSQNPAPGTALTFGTPTSVTITATDAGGNMVDCNFDVELIDVTPPSFTFFPPDITLSNDPSDCDRDYFYNQPEASDNCNNVGGSVVTITVASPTANGTNITQNANNFNQDFGSFPVGVTEVVYTATDGSGNATSQTFTVTVNDVTLPTLGGVPNSPVIVNTNPGVCEGSYSLPQVFPADNCGVQFITNDAPPSGIYPLGSTTVTFTVTDVAGNVATFSFDVIVEDNEDPVILTPVGDLDQSASADNGSCASTNVSLTDPAFADNCTGATVSNNAPASFPVGVTTVTYTVTDGSGNTATLDVIITVTDDEDPTFADAPGSLDMPFSADAGECFATVATVPAPTALDNCPGVTISSMGIPAGNEFPQGMTTVTYTATDASGNTATFDVVITVDDGEDPVFTSVPAPVTQGNDPGVCGAVVALVAAASDNCDPSVVITNDAPAVFGIGTTTVTFTATDDAGNTATATTTVTITDDEDPVFDAGQQTTFAFGSDPGVCEAAQTLPTPTFTDNCPGALLSDNAPSAFPVGSTTVTYTATDAAGNTATFDVTVTVSDTEAPIAQCQGVTIQLDANGDATVAPAQVNNGSTDNCGIVSYALDQTAFTCADIGPNIRTFTVTDAAGNTDQCTATITVEDNIAPTAVCQPFTVQLDASGNATITGMDIDGGSVDNCSITNLEAMPNTFTCAEVGVNTVILTVTDQSGNTSTCTAMVTVEDLIAPVISCSGVQTVAADASCAGVVPDYTTMPSIVSATDNCSAVLTQVPAAGTPLSLGVAQAVTVTATDPSGLFDDCTFNVTLIDVTPPVITCTGDIVGLSNDPGDCDRDFFFDPPVVMDNCMGISPSPVSVTVTTDNGTNITQGVVFGGNSGDFGSFPVGITTVTYTATDAALNSSSCSFTVEVLDNSLPTLGGLPPTITVSNDLGNCSAVVTPPFVFPADNCGVASVTHDAPAGNVYPVGTTVLTFTVTDVNGNSETFSSDVVVNDTEAPVVTQALTSLDQTVGSDAGVCGAVVTLVDPSATDNCGVHSIMNDAPALFPVGTTIVTYTVEDLAGNSATFTAEITVNDVEDPTFADAPGSLDMPFSADAGECFATVATVPAPTALDNCPGVTISSMGIPAGNEFPQGMTTVTYTATDASGNTATFDVVITVDDGEDPVFTSVPAPVTQGNDPGVCGAVVALVAAASDNCDPSVVITNDAPAVFGIGTTTVTFTATDDAGNTATATTTVTITDDEDPVFDAGQQTTFAFGSDPGVCEAAQTLPTPTFTDNCPGALLSDNAPSAFPVGSTTVTYTATDAAGNTATFDVTVTVSDTEAPIAQCQGVTIQLDANGDATVAPAQVNNGSTDNCGIVSYALDQTAFTCADIGPNIRTFTVTDAAGNTDQCTATITVEDNIAPTAVCQPFTVQLDASGNATITGMDIDGGSVDNCSIVNLEVMPSTFTCAHVGDNTVTLMVTDQSGNTSTCTAMVTVEDMIAPVISCLGDQTVGADASCAGVVPDYTTMPSIVSATDNCSAVLTQVPAAGTPLSLGVAQAVTVTATDPSGLFDDCTFNVTLIDVTAPTFTVSCPGDQVFDNNPSSCIRLYTFPRPTASDACNAGGAPTTVTVSADNGVSILQVGTNDFANFPVGVTTVTYTADDGNGNTTSCSFTVTVNDVAPPTLTNVPGDITVDSDAGVCGATVSWADVTASDNCSGVVLSSSHTPGSFFPVGVTTVTYTATDLAGMVTTMSFTVTVNDIEAPSLTCPASVTLTAPLATPTEASVTGLVATVADNCPGAATVSYTTTFNGTTSSPTTGDDASGTYPVGITTVEFEVSENGLVTDMCSFTVEVIAPNTNQFAVSAKAFLEGPLSGNLMDDGLRSAGLIPSADPYGNTANTVSAATLGVTGPDAIVDWVEVSLRDFSTGSILTTESGLIQRDGDIVDVSGSGPITFTGFSNGNYLISVNHRNHLGVSSSGLSMVNGVTTLIDFTQVATPTYNGSLDQKTIGGVRAMYAGDVNGDGQINYAGSPNDYNGVFFAVLTDPANPTFSLNHSTLGYSDADVNMDGAVNLTGSASDANEVFFQILLFPLNSTFSLNYTIIEFLP